MKPEIYDQNDCFRPIQPVISSMAVVVQEMVTAESAGVLFSRHPLNGDPRVTVITANYGLGESVVSAKAEPDTFFVKRYYKDDLELLGSRAGDKKIITQMDDHTSIQEVSLDEEKRKQLCLREDTVLKLAKLGIIMEKFFGTPRDLEFAVTIEGKIYLLQSRPITALHNFTDYEVIHENNTAVMSVDDVYSKVNSGEILLGSTSTFFQSIFCFDKLLHKDINGKGKFFGLFNYCIGVFHQHIFVNIGNVSLLELSSFHLPLQLYFY